VHQDALARLTEVDDLPRGQRVCDAERVVPHPAVAAICCPASFFLSLGRSSIIRARRRAMAFRMKSSTDLNRLCRALEVMISRAP